MDLEVGVEGEALSALEAGVGAVRVVDGRDVVLQLRLRRQALAARLALVVEALVCYLKRW